MSCIFSLFKEIPTFDERIQEVREELRLLEMSKHIEERKLVTSEQRVQFYKMLVEHIKLTGINYYNYSIIKQEYAKSNRRYELIYNRITNICKHIDALRITLCEIDVFLHSEC
jgi:hypothetical protein